MQDRSDNPISWWHRTLLAIACLLNLLNTELVSAGSVFFAVGGHEYQMQVESLQERRFATILKQKYDYSCGSAALATLLRFHYQHDLNAVEVFKKMYEQGDKNQINQLGFSLLDMKRYLNSLGYQAEGVRLTLEHYLKIARVPAIVMIETEGYKHFVVLKGIKNNQILIGDPARGLKSVNQAEFESMWSGLFFIITNKADVGRSAFNRDSDWSLLATAPLQEAFQRTDLGQFNLSLPTPNDFY